MTKVKLVRSYDEAGNIRTFVFETGGATWQAGQYQTWELPQIEDAKARKHFFTIAAAPSEEEFHISTRISDSVYKQTLNSLQPGSEIEVHDIEGDFTWEDDKPVVLVAGGIGVTPYRSILIERAALGKSLNAHLLYFGRDENFAFRFEFDQLASMHPELTIDYSIGEPITADTILAHAPEAAEKVTYLSGPEPMVDAVGEELQKRGVALKQDWFPGYTEKTY
ncbi:MAG TPA: FAD-dependent oxidoreductase [Dongiaceae bacterium]|nr:FAD-dependent oxidoreductase [Dongiaceae bacterium]